MNTGDVSLPLDKLRLDGGTQPRAIMSNELVREYAESMAAGRTFPPVVAFYDGTDYWLADGFHRWHAAKKAHLRAIKVEVKQGNVRDAILYSFGTNEDHGFRRSPDDKRRAVTRMIQDQEWTEWSDREIARLCRTSHEFVGKMRRLVAPHPPHTVNVDSELDLGEAPPRPARKYRNKQGKVGTMRTENIGKKSGRKPKDQPAAVPAAATSPPSNQPASPDPPDPAGRAPRSRALLQLRHWWRVASDEVKETFRREIQEKPV